MSLAEQISKELVSAMKAKDPARLRALRLIKSALLLLQTREGSATVNEGEEVATLVKLAKQRRDSIAIYEEQKRDDLARIEKEELAVIEEFLPKQLSEDELRTELTAIIAKSGASGMKDMGKVMGMATAALKGKADGAMISRLVKELLA